MLTIEGQPRPESSNGPGLPKASIPSKGTQCVETDSSFMTRDSVIYCGPGNYLELSNSLIAENKGYHGGAVYADAVDIGAIEFNGAILPLNTIFGTNRKPQLNPEYNRAVIYTLNGRKIDSYYGKVSVHSLRESAGRRLPKGMYIIALYLPGRQCKMEKLLVK